MRKIFKKLKMKKLLNSSEISGTVIAPPSKSVAQRAIAIASLIDGQSEIYNAGNSDDVQSVIKICKSLGADIQNDNDKLIINGGIKILHNTLDCGESGLCIRMFAPILATMQEKIVLTGTGTLKSRPMTMIENSLNSLGVNCQTQNGFIPVTVQGPFKKEHVTIDCSQSSQVLSGILIAAPICGHTLMVEIENLTSKPYIDLTIEKMLDFGVSVKNDNYRLFTVDNTENYKSAKLNVEGDWSGVAFMLVAGAIGGEIQVKGLNLNSIQADVAILDVLRKIGATVIEGQNSVKVKKNRLKNFEFDVTDCPDLFPPLAALAVYCNGVSLITGTERLKHKESDRVLALFQEFSKLGIEMQIGKNQVTIKGSQPHGKVVESHGDHRIAMALAVVSLRTKNVVHIKDIETVNKSYPDFFKDLKSCCIFE